jgi:hypothetical protein
MPPDNHNDGPIPLSLIAVRPGLNLHADELFEMQHDPDVAKIIQERYPMSAGEEYIDDAPNDDGFPYEIFHVGTPYEHTVWEAECALCLSMQAARGGQAPQ